MSILFEAFFTLVRGHFMAFSLFSAWHCLDNFLLKTYFFTSLTKVLAGLKEGMLCSGMIIVVFLEMLRAVFWARFLTMKLPKPLKYTFSSLASDSFTTSMKVSTLDNTVTLSTPVLLEISFTMSALVISMNIL